MFKIQLTLILSLFGCLASLLGFKIFHLEKQDYLIYQELLKSSRPTNALSCSRHTRKKTCKEIWYQDKNFHIESTDSELLFFHQNNRIEIIEELNHICCVVQEELYYLLPDGREAIQKEEGRLLIRGENPEKKEAWICSSIPGSTPMQLVRYLEAEKASYNYNTQLFIADEATLWHYRLEGHKPPLSFKEYTPLMEGKADSIELSLKEGKLDFQAHQMRATFELKENLF